MRVLLPILLLLLTATGCIGPIRQTGYLPGGYTEFNAINEKGMKLRVDPELLRQAGRAPLLTGQDTPTSHPAVFIVPEPQWLATVGTPEELARWDDVLFTVRERFYRYLLRVYPHPVRVRYALAANDPLLDGYRVYTVETAVTSYHPGTAWIRYLIGWGAGSVEIQIEGRIWDDTEERRLVAEFALREWHSGYAQSGMNTQVLKVEYCLRYAAEEIIAEFTTELPKYLPGIIYDSPTDHGIRMAGSK